MQTDRGAPFFRALAAFLLLDILLLFWLLNTLAHFGRLGAPVEHG